MENLSGTQLRHWQDYGWIKVESIFNKSEIAEISRWIDEIEATPDAGDQRLHYFEQVERAHAICRTEHFLEDHAELASLLTEGLLPKIAGQLVGEDVFLYKEKINYKKPSGAGFAPHQDATAHSDIEQPFTCLVAVDEMTEPNGCLFFGSHEFSLLPQDGDGCIDPDVAKTLDWQAIQMAPGDVLYFSALVPHKSGPNLTAAHRRAIYITYNAGREGDHRSTYYARRAREIEANGGRAHARISNIGHFQGVSTDGSGEMT